MNCNPVGWFEIYVEEMARAKAFYETVLAVKLERLDFEEIEMWAFPQIDGAMGASGALVKMAGLPVGQNSTMVYFNCDDCAEELGRVAGAGGQVFREKWSIGQYGYIALAIDTEGNMIGLHSRR